MTKTISIPVKAAELDVNDEIITRATKRRGIVTGLATGETGGVEISFEDGEQKRLHKSIIVDLEKRV